MKRKLKVAVNRRVINKIDKADKVLFGLLTTEFENGEMTLQELAESVNSGYPFCAQHQGRRKGSNFICSDVLAVDIDKNMTFDAALDHAFVKQYAGFVYTTPSHTDESHRFRIVFSLEETIDDPLTMRHAYQGLIRKFGGDASCKDACRLFFGSRGSDPIILDGILPVSEVNDLVRLGAEEASVPDRISTGAKKAYNVAARRSAMTFDPEHLIKLATGDDVKFANVRFGAPVHCPVHVDYNPSAFIVRSQSGGRGAYCSTCSATFWMREQNEVNVGNYDFYRVEDIVLEQQYQDDPANFHEDDDPFSQESSAHHSPSVLTHSAKLLVASQISVSNGVTFIRSPKGSGKTEALKHLVNSFRTQGKSVLLIGHRRALLRGMAKRLGLTCYLRLEEDGRGQNNWPTPYYAICIDSMLKLLTPAVHKYDVVIIDESEQVFSHLTGDTVMERRRNTHIQVFHYLANAESVIVADADLGPVTIEGVTQAMGGHEEYRFHLNRHRDLGSKIYSYDNEFHLMEEMLRVVAGGGRHFIATNSRKKAEQIREAITAQLERDVKVLLVTSKTVSEKHVQAFQADVQSEILRYDVVIASPTLGTGIDITFAGDAKKIDTVFGFFVARVTTHFDIDQQISRVRHPGAVKVWISPEQYVFETEPDVILREAIANGALNDSLIGYEPDGTPVYNDSRYLNVYAHVMAVARASKNALRKNFHDLRKRNGWEVVQVASDDERSKAGRSVAVEAREAVKQAQATTLCVAETITPEDYEALREVKGTLSKAEVDSMNRFELERFYNGNISPELVKLDNDGRYRQKIELLELYLSSNDELTQLDRLDSELHTVVTDAKKRVLQRRLLCELLASAGLADSSSPLKLDVVMSSADLSEFVACVRKNALALQDVFELPIRADLVKKPMTQLGLVLEMMGLRMTRDSTKKVAGKKTYNYCLDGKAHGQAYATLHARGVQLPIY